MNYYVIIDARREDFFEQFHLNYKAYNFLHNRENLCVDLIKN